MAPLGGSGSAPHLAHRALATLQATLSLEAWQMVAPAKIIDLMSSHGTCTAEFRLSLPRISRDDILDILQKLGMVPPEVSTTTPGQVNTTHRALEQFAGLLRQRSTYAAVWTARLVGLDEMYTGAVDPSCSCDGQQRYTTYLILDGGLVKRL